MKNLNNYITEKLRLTKDSKLQSTVKEDITKFFVIYANKGRTNCAVFSSYNSAKTYAKEFNYIDGYCFTVEQWTDVLNVIKIKNGQEFSKNNEKFFEYVKENNVISLFDYENLK